MRTITSSLSLSLSAVAIAGCFTAACANQVEDEGEPGMMAGDVADGSSDEKAMTATCAPGTTVKGVDVSYYQDNIDWAAAAGDGVKYAFIRVSDGANFNDSKFQRNWDGAKANGILRGAYQFFRSNQDPIAQADLLVAKLGGALHEGDLPPVIDVESADGQSMSTIQSKVNRWLDRVESKLGVRPIVYTGPYFWRDTVGGADQTRSALWIAHYGTSCPMVPPRWTNWTFHQNSSSGHVRGIPGNVDMDLFNGTLAQLRALASVASQPPPPPPPPPSGDCEAMDAAGGIIDDGDACFEAGGAQQWLHRVTNDGNGGDLIKTGTTASTRTENYGEWTLNMAAEGTYELEVFIGHAGTSQKARYTVTHADGSTDAVINQNAHYGWVSLGAYRLLAGTAGKVRLNDNTGEAGSLNRDLVFDGLRVTPVDASTPPPPAADPCPRIEVHDTGSVLNIRAQPNTNQAAIGTLDDGSIVNRLDTVTGQVVSGTSTWFKITDGQVSGFVTAAYARCHS